MFLIRQYIDSDFDVVVTLWYHSWTKAFPNLKHPQSFEEWKFRFQNDYAKQKDIWIAQAQDRIVGFIAVSDNEINQIFVDIGVQRNGVGTALLNQAKQMNPSGLKLTTLQQNIQARQFYEKHDFIAGAMGINPINGQPSIEYYWNP